jgi:hypothetical protein
MSHAPRWRAAMVSPCHEGWFTGCITPAPPARRPPPMSGPVVPLGTTWAAHRPCERPPLVAAALPRWCQALAAAEVPMLQAWLIQAPAPPGLRIRMGCPPLQHPQPPGSGTAGSRAGDTATAAGGHLILGGAARVTPRAAPRCAPPAPGGSRRSASRRCPPCPPETWLLSFVEQEIGGGEEDGGGEVGGLEAQAVRVVVMCNFESSPAPRPCPPPPHRAPSPRKFQSTSPAQLAHAPFRYVHTGWVLGPFTLTFSLGGGGGGGGGEGGGGEGGAEGMGRRLEQAGAQCVHQGQAVGVGCSSDCVAEAGCAVSIHRGLPVHLPAI